MKTIVWKNCSWHINLSSLTSTSQSFALVHAVIGCEKHNSLYFVISKIFAIQNNSFTAFPYSAVIVFCMQTMASSGKMYIDCADCCTSWTAIIIWSHRLLVRKDLPLKSGGPHTHPWLRLHVHFQLSGRPFRPPSIHAFILCTASVSMTARIPRELQEPSHGKNTHIPILFPPCQSVLHLGQRPSQDHQAAAHGHEPALTNSCHLSISQHPPAKKPCKQRL